MHHQDEPQPLIAALVHHYDELVRYASRILQGQASFAGKQDASGIAAQRPHDTHDLAREAVHEVCLQLLRDTPRCAEPVRVPLAFLRTLSKRRAIDGLRSEALWQRLACGMETFPDGMEPAASPHAEPYHRCYARQQFTLLVQAIESLPPRCRDVFVLHKIHEWPQSQVAAHLGISLKTVEKHLRIGVACCRVALAEILEDARQPTHGVPRLAGMSR